MTIVTQYSWETDTFTDHAPTTDRQAFRAALHVVAEKAREKLPECNGRVDKAVALVLSGDVTLQADGSASRQLAVCPCETVPSRTRYLLPAKTSRTRHMVSVSIG